MPIVTGKSKLPVWQNSTGEWILSLFFFFSLGYFLWRASCPFIVWDDTSSASFNAFVAHRHYSFLTPHFLIVAFKGVFSQIQGDGYRPLSELIRLTGASYFVESGRSPVPFIGFNAVVMGSLSAAYFSLAGRFLKSNQAALFAVFLFLFSTPVLSASLVTFSGIQALVPLVITTGLVCYFQITDNRPYKRFWFILLLGLFLIAPWVREFAGLLPLLIIILELERAKKLTWIMGLGVVFFLHALFPTALMHWLAFPNLDIRPVFAMGNLGAFLSKGTQNNPHLHWRIFLDVVSVYPPTLFVLAFLACFVKGAESVKERVVERRNTRFLLIFFVLSFLPFLKLFNEQVHLSYSLVPLSILLAIAVEKWVLFLSEKPVKFAWRFAFLAVLGVIIADHTLNVYAVRQATREIYDGVFKMADWFKTSTPLGTIVITNAHHLEDIRYYSQGHIEPWGAPGGIPDQTRWMHNTSDLQKLLDERGHQPVYFFDVEIKNRKGQRGEERVHYYAKRGVVDTEDLGVVHTTSFRYPYLDPLKMLIPVEETPWPGPPDLEFDFYRGPALDGTPFLREVYAEYHVYKVVGKKVRSSPAFQSKSSLKFPQLVEENYKGFNLISFQNRIYAILQSDGAFDIEKFKAGGYRHGFEASDIAGVKRQMDTLTLPVNPPVPKLVEENYHHFNIISFDNQMYAILQSEGAFDIARVEKGGYSRLFKGVNVEEVKRTIDKAL